MTLGEPGPGRSHLITGGSKTKVDAIQVIQAVTVLSPIVGGHQQPLKGSLNHPKKVTRRMIRMVILIDLTRVKSQYIVFGLVIDP